MIEVLESMSRQQPTEFGILIDEATTTGVTYVGKYNPEATFGTGRDIFQIIIIDERTATTHVYYAENSRSFNKIWDSRVSYLK